MSRLALIALAFVALAACTSAGDTSAPWYEGGTANYDALKRAHDACVGKGGDFQVRPGGDPTHLDDYDCKNAKGS
jgi:hypothetical protein